MIRQFPSIALFLATVVFSIRLEAQVAAPPRSGPETSLGNAGLRRNSFEPNQTVALENKIIKPIPLSVDSQRNALASIDRNVADQIRDLSEKLKTILPDEIDILAKTNGWKTADQQALVTAWRAGDPTTVYEAWVQGNRQDTAGAELAARQTDVKRLLARLSQDSEENKVALKQNVAEFDKALGKIAGPTPAVSELAVPLKTLKTWVTARTLIETATPGKGGVARLPAGSDVTLIFDPTLARGIAIVLSDEVLLIGREGQSSLVIERGNPAEALGLPIVTGTPMPDAQGDEVLAGVLVVNPASTRATINYNINGNHYLSKSGMQQKLPVLAKGRNWTIEFDRGENFGTAVYTLTPATYYFRPTDLGWQLYQKRFEIVLDNSQSNQEFNFIFQGENLIVPAGGTRTLMSSYPIWLRYDRGNGSEFVCKAMPFYDTTVQIGVNASDNLWDLFPTNNNRRESPKLKPFNADRLGKR